MSDDTANKKKKHLLRYESEIWLNGKITMILQSQNIGES